MTVVVDWQSTVLSLDEEQRLEWSSDPKRQTSQGATEGLFGLLVLDCGHWTQPPPLPRDTERARIERVPAYPRLSQPILATPPAYPSLCQPITPSLCQPILATPPAYPSLSQPILATPPAYPSLCQPILATPPAYPSLSQPMPAYPSHTPSLSQPIPTAGAMEVQGYFANAPDQNIKVTNCLNRWRPTDRTNLCGCRPGYRARRRSPGSVDRNRAASGDVAMNGGRSPRHRSWESNPTHPKETEKKLRDKYRESSNSPGVTCHRGMSPRPGSQCAGESGISGAPGLA
ncbi:hypothetical protein RRG08_052096 [Elysia crispata]|uniref:Uncharacterized protein n=1 Tax=Elysia crispata TaxID=231223 RepID=A0AAE1DSR7_9GAST|nr:hypothetical protein RRG08_052096 [Elysia crispata]